MTDVKKNMGRLAQSKAMKPYIDIADDVEANGMNKSNQL